MIYLNKIRRASIKFVLNKLLKPTFWPFQILSLSKLSFLIHCYFDAFFCIIFINLYYSGEGNMLVSTLHQEIRKQKSANHALRYKKKTLNLTQICIVTFFCARGELVCKPSNCCLSFFSFWGLYGTYPIRQCLTITNAF